MNKIKLLSIAGFFIAGLSIIILPALLSACSDDFNIPGNDGGDGFMPITFSPSYPTQTRASDGGFEQGDRMGLYILDYEDGEPEEITGVPHADNVRCDFDETDNKCKPVTDLYWRSKDTPADFISYYPFESQIHNPKAMKFEVQRRQDETGTSDKTGGYEASDFLYVKQTKVMPTGGAVPLTYRHLLAGLRITLSKGEGFADEEWQALEKSVVIVNSVTSGNIDLSDGSVNPGSDRNTIIPLCYAGDFRAVTFPQIIPAGQEILSVTVGSTGYSFSRESEMNLVSGKLHSFTIKVSKKGEGEYSFDIESIGITDWIDSVDFRDGLMRQYVVIDVDDQGKLNDAIAARQINTDKIYNLKLRGRLNERDFQYIREKIPYLKALNLYDSRCECFIDSGGGHAGIEKDILPVDGLREISTLTHVIYPRILREIGDRALMKSGIMGDVIIPEGVVRIGGEAFMDCHSIMGLSLPSSLREIGGAAFLWSSLTGELSLPSGLRTIADEAFSCCNNVSGELRLPESLEHLGISAFNGCRFSGSLSFPQGIKKIPAGCFAGGFTGTLTLPEGVEVIEDQAFLNCGFRGELALPSTVREIGAQTFQNTQFSSVVFPKGLRMIEWGAFAECSRLQGTIELPENLSVIPSSAFANCRLIDEIIIPRNIRKIGVAAFQNCYNLSGVTSFAIDPPLLETGYIEDNLSRPLEAFEGVALDNFTLQVPQESLTDYQRDAKWSEFKRISAYSNFVCRPASACALNTRHEETLVLNSDGDWEATHIPDWCTVSPPEGAERRRYH